ncbi:hypothetical protein [Haloterrigena alkaliphila]|nr:hypothetical protein [Haloterrigena alkaliphila]UHQ95013.1 hypothetical protein J0X25_18860 [Haloterrigena alkaliphila]
MVDSDRDKWAGFGALSTSGAETAAGMTRVREELRGGMCEDIAAMS